VGILVLFEALGFRGPCSLLSLLPVLELGFLMSLGLCTVGIVAIFGARKRDRRARGLLLEVHHAIRRGDP
jgi:hypothetical protein